MSEQTPSQAEGERQQDADSTDDERETSRRNVPRTTPSQAEGDDTGAEDGQDGEKRQDL
jgi:hypothetical protein